METSQPSRPSDSEDLVAAKRGDRDALGRLLARHRRRLDQLARQNVGPLLRAKFRASDLLQGTYLDVLRGLPAFEGTRDEAFGAWIEAIFEHNVRDHVRFAGAARRTPEQEMQDLDLDREPAPVPTPSSEASFSEELLAIHDALSRLQPDHRRVLELRWLEELNHEQMAERLGRSVVATRSLLARARAELLLALYRRRRDTDDSPS